MEFHLIKTRTAAILALSLLLAPATLAPTPASAGLRDSCADLYRKIRDSVPLSARFDDAEERLRLKGYQLAPAKLGEGFSAVVYEGKDPSTGAPIAIKVPKPGLTNQRNLETEAEISHRIEPHDPQGLFMRYDWDQERNVLVSPYAKGFETLDQWVREHSSGIAGRAVEKIEAQLRDSLKVLRQSGIVHSDLGYENILIHPETRELRIIDYGIAAEPGKYPVHRKDLLRNRRGGRIKSPNQQSDAPAQFGDDEFTVEEIIRKLRSKSVPEEGRADSIEKLNPGSAEWIRLTTRDGRVSDPGFPVRLHDSLTETFDPYVSRLLKGEHADFEEMLREQHRILSSGKDGKSQYYGASMGPWNRVVGNSAVPGKFRNEAYHGPSLYRWRLTISVRDRLGGQKPTPRSSPNEKVLLEGIPEDALPSRKVGSDTVTYSHPDPKFVPLYLNAMKSHLEVALELMSKNAPAEEILPHLADYLQLGLAGHLFSVGNFSLYMTQVNALVRKLGFAGISPGYLDYHALVEDPSEFRARFLRLAREK